MLLGKYRVDEIIGRGGMGLVVKAWHLGLGERVAIKLLRDDLAVADDAVARLVREAQAAVKLTSEHAARIRDVGTFDDGKPYMVMEYLEGQDLGEMLGEVGRLSPSLAIDLVIQACEALAEAHSLGIVHRDIKPTNLFVTSRRDGSVLLKVLDFGISKAPSGPELYLTQTWSVLGTPAYMSPEQMRSAHDVDARTDVWSLGAVLYELLEGHAPFRAASFSEMCVQVAVEPPSPMTATPPDLVPIISRCLAKSADDRYPSVADLARDLARLTREPARAQIVVDRMVWMLERGSQPQDTTIQTSPEPVEDETPLDVPAIAAREPASAIGIPLGPIAALAVAAPPTLAAGATLAAGTPTAPAAPAAILAASAPRSRIHTGPVTLRWPPAPPLAPPPALAPPPGLPPPPALAPPPGLPPPPHARVEVEPTLSYPEPPTYAIRVPLPLPLHDDARFPRPGFRLPRGAQTRPTASPAVQRRGRGWLLAVATAIIAIAAVIGVIAATRSGEAPPPALGPRQGA